MTHSMKGWARRGRLYRHSPLYGFNKSRQLEGTISKGPLYGCYTITANRVWAAWGSVAYHRFPYPRGPVQWPIVEPPGLDEIAKYNRHYSHFRARTIQDVKICLSRRTLVQFAVPITAAWRSTRGGLISLPGSRKEFTGEHAVIAMGYDDNTSLLKFRNSWGMSWGDEGYGYLPYNYFTEYVSEAWFPWPDKLENWSPPRKCASESFAKSVSIFNNALGRVSAVIDLWRLADEIRIGWCFMTLYEGDYLDIEDFFVRSEFQADHTDRLITEVDSFRKEQSDLQIRLWVTHADVHYGSANFAPINELVRKFDLSVTKSPVPWAAYVAR